MVKYIFWVSVALVIQNAKHMDHIILSSVACLAEPYFSTYLVNDTIFFGGGGVEINWT